MRTIGIVSGKGGVGKTTLAANLGMSMLNFGRRVTLVDCNVTASHLGFNFGLFYYPTTLNNVLKREATMEQASHYYNGLRIIPASLDIDDLLGLDIEDLSRHISSLSNTDIVLLDSSAGLGKEATSVLKSCDEVLFVATPYMASISDVIRCYKVVRLLGIRPLGVALNMVSNMRHELSVRDIESLTRLPVISKIPFDPNIQKSLAVSKPIVLSNPHSPASIEINRLAASLLGEEYEYSSSMFSRLYFKLRNLI